MSTLQLGQQFNSYDEFMSALLAFQEVSRHRFVKHYQKTVQWATQNNNVCPAPQPRLRYYRLKMNCSRKESKAAGGDCGTWIRLGVTKDGERLEVVAMELKECGPPAPTGTANNSGNRHQNPHNSQPSLQASAPSGSLPPQAQVGCDPPISIGGISSAQSSQIAPVMAPMHSQQQQQQQMYYDQSQPMYHSMDGHPQSSYQPANGAVQYTELQTSGYVPVTVTNQQLAESAAGVAQDSQSLQGLPPLPSFGHLGGFQQPVQPVQSIVVQHGYQSEATAPTGPPQPPPSAPQAGEQIHHPQQQYATAGQTPTEQMYSSHPQGGYRQMEYHSPIAYHTTGQQQAEPQHTTSTILQPLYQQSQQPMHLPPLSGGHLPQSDVASMQQNQQTNHAGHTQQQQHHHLVQQVSTTSTNVIGEHPQTSRTATPNTSAFGSSEQRQVYSQHSGPAGAGLQPHAQQTPAVQSGSYVSDYGQVDRGQVINGRHAQLPPQSQPHYQEMQSLNVGQTPQIMELNNVTSMSEGSLPGHTSVQMDASQQQLQQQQQGYVSGMVSIDSTAGDPGLLYADLSQPQVSYQQHIQTGKLQVCPSAPIDSSSKCQRIDTAVGSNQMTPLVTTPTGSKKKKTKSVPQEKQLDTNELSSQQKHTSATHRTPKRDQHNPQVVLHLKDLTSDPSKKAGPRNSSTLEALLGNSGPRRTSASSAGGGGVSARNSRAESEAGSVVGGTSTMTNIIQPNSTGSTSLELRGTSQRATDNVPELYLGQTYSSYKAAEQAVENYASPKGFKFRKIGSMLLKRIEGKEKLKEQFANATADPGIKYFALKFRCVRSRQLTMVSNYVKKKKDEDGHVIQETPVPTTAATDANQNNNDSISNSVKVPMGSCSARITFQLNAHGTGLEVKQLDESHDHAPDDELREKFKLGIARSLPVVGKSARLPKSVRETTNDGIGSAGVVPDSAGADDTRNVQIADSDRSPNSPQRNTTGGSSALNLPLEDSFLNEQLVSEQLHMMNGGDDEAEPEVDLLSNIQSLAEEIDKLSETDGLPADLASLDAALKHDDLGGLGLGGHLSREGLHVPAKEKGQSLSSHRISDSDNNNIGFKNTNENLPSGEGDSKRWLDKGSRAVQEHGQVVKAESDERDSKHMTIVGNSLISNGHHRELTEEQVVPKDQINKTSCSTVADCVGITNILPADSGTIKTEADDGGKVVPEVSAPNDPIDIKENVVQPQTSLTELKRNGRTSCSWNKEGKDEPLEQREMKQEFLKLDNSTDITLDGDSDSVMVNYSSSLKSESAPDEDIKDDIPRVSPDGGHGLSEGTKELGPQIPNNSNNPDRDGSKTKRNVDREIKKFETNIGENSVTFSTASALRKRSLKIGSSQEDTSSSVICSGVADTSDGTKRARKMSIQDAPDSLRNIDDSSKEKTYCSSGIAEAGVVSNDKSNGPLLNCAQKEGELTRSCGNETMTIVNDKDDEDPSLRTASRSRTARGHSGVTEDESESEGSIYVPPTSATGFTECGGRTARRTSRVRTRGKRSRGNSGGSVIVAHDRYSKGIVRGGPALHGTWEGHDEPANVKRNLEETLRARHLELRGCKVLVQMADLPKDFEVYWSEEDIQRQLEEAERDEANETLRQIAQILASNKGDILAQRRQLLTSLLYHWRAENHVSLLASSYKQRRTKVENISCIITGTTPDTPPSTEDTSAVGVIGESASTCQEVQLQQKEIVHEVKVGKGVIGLLTSSPSEETTDAPPVEQNV